MKIILQGFYWDAPLIENRCGEWWTFLTDQLASIRSAGIDTIWLPPLSKSCEGDKGMGYDGFDIYDLGEFNQKGTVRTMFGSRRELDTLIEQAHSLGLKVIAEFLFSHCRGGESELNPAYGQTNPDTLRACKREV